MKRDREKEYSEHIYVFDVGRNYYYKKKFMFVFLFFSCLINFNAYGVFLMCYDGSVNFCGNIIKHKHTYC